MGRGRVNTQKLVGHGRLPADCETGSQGRAIGQHGAPAKITIDKSTANTAAIENYNSEHDTKIELRQVKYLNNIVEQDHRAIDALEILDEERLPTRLASSIYKPSSPD